MWPPGENEFDTPAITHLIVPCFPIAVAASLSDLAHSLDFVLSQTGGLKEDLEDQIPWPWGPYWGASKGNHSLTFSFCSLEERFLALKNNNNEV